VAHLLARFEDGYSFLDHRNEVTCLWVAASASTTLFHRKRAKATKLNPIPLRERIADGAEDRVHNLLYVTRIQMRVLLRQLSDQFGFKHIWRKPLMWSFF
jgi:hypothetical protein